MHVNSNSSGEAVPWSGRLDTDSSYSVGTGSPKNENKINKLHNSYFDEPGDAFESIEDDFNLELSQFSDGGPWSRPPELDNTRWDDK